MTCREARKQRRHEKKLAEMGLAKAVLVELAGAPKEAFKSIGYIGQGIARAHGTAFGAWLGNDDPLTWAGGGVAAVAYISWLNLLLTSVKIGDKTIAERLGLAGLRDAIPTTLAKTAKEVLDDLGQGVPVEGGSYCFVATDFPGTMLCFATEAGRNGAWSVARLGGLLGDTRFPNGGNNRQMKGPYPSAEEANKGVGDIANSRTGYQVVRVNDGRWIILYGKPEEPTPPSPPPTITGWYPIGYKAGNLVHLGGPYATRDEGWAYLNPALPAWIRAGYTSFDVIEVK